MDRFTKSVKWLEMVFCLAAAPLIIYLFLQAFVIFTRELDKVRALTEGRF